MKCYALTATLLTLWACGQEEEGSTVPEAVTAPAAPKSTASRLDTMPPLPDSLPPYYTVFPNTEKGQTIGNTGLAIDTVRGRLIFARYDWTRSSKVVFRSRTNEDLGGFDITPYLAHIQGIAYNERERLVYVWGQRPGGGLTSPQIGVFDEQGNPKALPHATSPRDGRPGQLAWDERRQVLWVKGNGNSIAYAYTPEWVCKWTLDFGIAGEGIAIDEASGDFWVADKAGVYRAIPATDGPEVEILERRPNPTFTGASEGLAYDPFDGTVWLNADEGLHGNYQDGNRVWRLLP